MPRFIPPHLLIPLILLIFILWIMLVHHFRRNTTVHRWILNSRNHVSPSTCSKASWIAICVDKSKWHSEP